MVHFFLTTTKSLKMKQKVSPLLPLLPGPSSLLALLLFLAPFRPKSSRNRKFLENFSYQLKKSSSRRKTNLSNNSCWFFQRIKKTLNMHLETILMEVKWKNSYKYEFIGKFFITRPNCALDRSTILCLYVLGFQRQVLKYVPKCKWIPQTKFPVT